MKNRPGYSVRPSISVITPVHNREDTIGRCMESVIFQTESKVDYEHIIVDDASTDGTVDKIKEISEKYKDRQVIRLIQMDKHSERAICRNTGMAKATKNWILWLDSDDMLTQRTVEVLMRNINKTENKVYRAFNYGSIVHHKDDSHTIRPVFTPKPIRINRYAGHHEPFVSGKIGTGSFIFKRRLLEEIGMLPHVSDPYSFKREALKEFREEWEKYPELFDKYLNTGVTLGNPWGDDYYMFYKITRHVVSKPLNINLYYHNVR